MDRLARAILGLRGTLAYVLIFGLPALEASAFIGLAIPGELAVLLGGVLAFQGRVWLPGALAAAITGAVVGDSLGYVIGARYGERLLATRLGRRLVKPEHRKRAEELIRRRGASAVFVGRLSAVLRVLIPGLAGMSGMAYGRFLVFNVLGGVVWAGGFVLLGYAAGNAWRSAAHVAARASAVLAALLALIGMAVLAARWVIRHEAEVRSGWAWLLERPRVVAFRRRYARQIAFTRDRLDPRRAFGLYLTLGLAATVAMGWALGAAVQDLFAGEELVGIDRPIGQFLAAHRSVAMSEAMRAVTAAGSPSFVVAVLVVASALTVARQRSVRPAAYLATAVGGGYVVDRVLKLLLHAARPLHPIVAAAGYSFPSGQVVAAVTLYGGLAFVISRLFRSWRLAVWTWLAAAVVVLLVATSRVWLGVQHASGVVAAAALGAMWLALSSTAWLTWDRLGESPAFRQTRNRAARKGIRWVLFGATLAILVHVVLLALPGIRHSASAIRSANLWLVALALVAEVLSNAALPEVYRRSLKALGEDVGYRRALSVSMGMFTVGHVLPGGGAAAAVWGVRRLANLGVDAATATTAVILGGTLGMTTLGGIVFVGAALSLARGDVSPVYAAAVGLVLLALASLGIAAWKAVRSPAARHRMLGVIEAALEKVRIRADVAAWRASVDAMAAAVANRRAMLKIVRWSALNWVTDIAALWLMFLAFGYRMHIGVLVVGYGVANLLAAFPVVPGGLGLVEAGFAGTYAAFGVPGSITVVAVLAYRLVSYWLPVLAGVPGYLGAGRAERREARARA